MYELRIKNARLYVSGFLTEGEVGISDGKIQYIGKEKIRGEKTIDARKNIVMPGLMNAHTHLAMALFRGFAEDLPLEKWLQMKIWPAERKLTSEDVYYGSLLGIIEMIRTGTTCFSDLYVEMDEVARAAIKAGIRGCLCYGMADRGDEERGEKELKIGMKFVKKWKGSEIIYPLYGPHSTYTCSPKFLETVKETAKEDGVPVHIHASENQWEIQEVKRQCGATPIKLLYHLEFLDEHTILAHCVWVSDEEIQMLKNSKTNVVHNPVSNLKLAAGISPVFQFLRKGINVSLGTDGAASNNSYDLFEEVKITPLLQKVVTGRADAISVREVIEMATVNGYKAYGLNGGELEIGKLADIIIIDISGINHHPSYNPLNNLVYSGRGCDVTHTIINGRVVMEDRNILTLNEEKIIGKIERMKQKFMDD
jgi:5-methylthioadenosine/S-adenosylhomocysteine deaminase